MNPLVNSLENFGLTSKEANIYFVMLESGHRTALKISQLTGIKRSTVYLILDSLIKKRLIKLAAKGKKRYFFPEDPDKIIKIMDERREEINKILPLINNLYKSKSEKPLVAIYEGKDMVRDISKKILNCKSQVMWFGSVSEYLEEFVNEYIHVYREQESDPDFEGVREIVNNNREQKEYAKEVNKSWNKKFKIKTLPKKLFFPDSICAIYEDKLAIFLIKKNYFVIMIENSDISNLFKCMFDLSWESAVTPK